MADELVMLHEALQSPRNLPHGPLTTVAPDCVYHENVTLYKITKNESNLQSNTTHSELSLPSQYMDAQ